MKRPVYIGEQTFFSTLKNHFKNGTFIVCTMNDDPVSDTIRRRGGYRGIIREEEVDIGQGHILGEITDLEFENLQNKKRSIFSTLKQAGTDICMFNGIPKLKILRYIGQCPLIWSSKKKLFKPAEPIFIDNLQF